MMKINIQSKNPTVATSTVSYVIGGESIENFIQTCQKEVQEYSKNQKKRFQIQLSATLTGLLSTLQVTTALAATSDPIISGDLIKLLISVLVLCVIIGAVLAMILLAIAGMGIMLGKKEKAKTWSIDIIKGAGQVLLAPTIIMVMILLLNVLFQGSGIYINPLRYFPHPVFGN